MKMLKIALLGLALLTTSVVQPQWEGLSKMLGAKSSYGSAVLHNFTDKDIRAEVLDMSKWLVKGADILDKDLGTIKPGDQVRLTYTAGHQLEICTNDSSHRCLHYDFTSSYTDNTLQLLLLSTPTGIPYLIRAESMSSKIQK